MSIYSNDPTSLTQEEINNAIDQQYRRRKNHAKVLAAIKANQSQ